MRVPQEQRKHLAVGAVLLAAGPASRMGHRPKCLLELDGQPLIQRQLRAMTHIGFTQIVVVTGYYAELIKPIVTQFPVTLVHNPTPDEGQSASLHCGLRALSEDLDGVLVALADQPLIEAQDIDDLLHAYRKRPRETDAIVSMVNDLPGNPVVFSDAVRKAILCRDRSYGGKQWQMENSERLYRWPTANEHYRIDIDTLDDIETFRARTGLCLRWPSTL